MSRPLLRPRYASGGTVSGRPPVFLINDYCIPKPMSERIRRTAAANYPFRDHRTCADWSSEESDA